MRHGCRHAADTTLDTGIGESGHQTLVLMVGSHFLVYHLCLSVFLLTLCVSLNMRWLRSLVDEVIFPESYLRK